MNKLPIAFMHIAKTAGTSLRAMFEEQIPSETIVELQGTDVSSRQLFDAELEVGLIAGRELRTVQLVHGHFPFWVCRSIQCRPVTLLRHPAELLASFYYYARNELSRMEAHRDAEFVQDALKFPFEGFLEKRSSNAICKSLCDDGNSEGIFNLVEAKERLSSMAFGISELFEQSAELIFSNLGLEKPTAIRLNVTRNKPELSSQQRELVKLHSPDDCELYEWARAEFQARY